jgi:twitching motility protein PilT
MSKSMSALIKEGKSHMIPNYMQAGKSDGNLTLTESLFALVTQGSITAEEALAAADDDEAMALLLSQQTDKHSA